MTCPGCGARMACIESRSNGANRVRHYRCRACGAERFMRDVEMEPAAGRRALNLLEKLRRVKGA